MQDTEQIRLPSGNVEVLPPILRPYQRQFIADAYTQIRAGRKRILGFSGTGSGKTVIAAQIIAHAVARKRRTLFVVHRDTLISQTHEKLTLFGVGDCGFIKSGWSENRDALIQVASIQTLARRDWWHDYAADLIILDEAHLTSFHEIVRRMMDSIYPQAIYLGLTATPWRLSKRESLGDIYESLVSAPMPHEMIDAGFLSKPSYFSPKSADLESVGTNANGDFDEGELALACDHPELIEQTVREWLGLVYGRRTIVFAINVAHARHLAGAFNAAGVSAAWVDGTMPEKVTNRIYQQLATGETMVLASCQKLVEGFDLPSVNAVVLARPTQSRSLHFQMIGRGLRLSPQTGKTDCLVIDTAGNIFRHGFVEDITHVSLAASAESFAGDAPYKICPQEHGGCSSILYSFVMECPNCGYVFPQPKKVYIVPELEQALSEEDIERYELYREKLRCAYQKNFDPNWASHIFREKYGHWPPETWARAAVFGVKPTPEHGVSYYNYLVNVALRKEKQKEWVQRYMNLEFGFTVMLS